MQKKYVIALVHFNNVNHHHAVLNVHTLPINNTKYLYYFLGGIRCHYYHFNK